MLGYRTMQEFDDTMTHAEFIDWLAVLKIEREARNGGPSLEDRARERQGL